MSEKTFIDIHQVSGMLSVSIPTIYAWRDRDDFPQPYKFGRRAYRWDLEEIEQFIQDSRETAGV
jgi:predicted DNA-binding transcriptional regulator AlpA